MAFELIIATLAGVIAGIFTGITPGLHINLVAAVAQEFSAESVISPLFLAAAIVAMSITHTFLDFIPSVFSAPRIQILPLQPCLGTGCC